MDFQKRRFLQAFALIFLIFMTANAQSESPNVPPEWRTLAEQTDYRKSWNYADTIAFARKLDKASDKIVYQSFGKAKNLRPPRRAKAAKRSC
jgi:hypothetical protein